MFNKLTDYYNLKKPQKITHILAGLGNPGKEYEKTRHNVGWLALDYLLEKEKLTLKKLRFNALSTNTEIEGTRVLILKPQTYMNKSGQSIALAADYYNIPPENIIVLCDDIEQQPGKLRIRTNGGAGGQNGLKDIVNHMGKGFPRIRIGIGEKPNPNYDLADWVTSKLTDKDLKEISGRYDDVYNAIKLMLKGDINNAMNRFN